MNAKTEFLFDIGNNKVKCAHIHDENILRSLSLCYDDVEPWKDYNKFLKSIDFEYDSWYWGQVLFGNIRLDDWTRLERWEYDWSEWRSHKVCPKIPEILIS
jgi:hypothetical protein